MMPKISFITSLLTVFCCLFSCSNEQDDPTNNHSSIQFKSSIVLPQTMTRAANWGSGEIGVYMFKNDATYTQANILKANKMHSISESDIFSNASEEDALFFPEDGSRVDFVAYYPFQSAINNHKYSIDVSNQKNLHQIDFRLSGDSKNLNNSQSEHIVPLNFKHQLSNIVLNISTKESNNLKGLKVGISGMPTQADFSLIDQTFTENINSIQDIILNTLINDDMAKCEAIVLPVENIKGSLFFFYLPSLEKTLEWPIPEDHDFKSNFSYIYNIELQTAGKFNIKLTSTLSEWNNEEEKSITVNKDSEKQVEIVGDNEKKLFLETFGNEVIKTPKIAKLFTNWDMKSPIVYYSNSDKVLIKHEKGNNFVWIPAKSDAYFQIQNIPNGIKNVKLTFNFETRSSNYLETLILKCNGIVIDHHIRPIAIPDNTTKIEFVSNNEKNTTGFKIDNIKLTGEI